MRPFALFGVIYFVFTEIAKVDASVDALRAVPAVRDRPLHVLRRGDGGLGAVAGRARVPAAQDALPADRVPLAVDADRAAQPRD